MIFLATTSGPQDQRNLTPWLDLGSSEREQLPADFARASVAAAQKTPTINHFVFCIDGADDPQPLLLARKAIDHLWLTESRPNRPTYIFLTELRRAVAKPGDNQEKSAHEFNAARFDILDHIFGHPKPRSKNQWAMDQRTTGQQLLGLRHGTDLPSLTSIVEEYTDRYNQPFVYFESVPITDSQTIVSRLKPAGLAWDPADPNFQALAEEATSRQAENSLQ